MVGTIYQIHSLTSVVFSGAQSWNYSSFDNIDSCLAKCQKGKVADFGECMQHCIPNRTTRLDMVNLSYDFDLPRQYLTNKVCR